MHVERRHALCAATSLNRLAKCDKAVLVTKSSTIKKL